MSSEKHRKSEKHNKSDCRHLCPPVCNPMMMVPTIKFQQFIVSTGTSKFTFPAGVSSVIATLNGGGGSGGGLKNIPPIDGIGAGGGGGAFLTAQITGVPGITVLTVTAGMGSTATSTSTPSTITGPGVNLVAGGGQDGSFMTIAAATGPTTVAGGAGGVPSFSGINVSNVYGSTGLNGQNGFVISASTDMGCCPDALQQSGNGGSSPMGGSGGWGARRLSDAILPGSGAFIEPTTLPTNPGGGGSGQAEGPPHVGVARLGADGVVIIRFASLG